MNRGIALATILLVIGGLLAFVAFQMDWDLDADAHGARGTRLGPPETYVRRAALHNERVWIVNYGGQLWSLAENEGTPARELENSGVISLCSQRDRLDVLIADGAGWRMMTRVGAAWSPSAHIRSSDDFALTLVCGESPALLTDRRLIDGRTGRLLARLQKRLPTFPDNLASSTGGQIYFSAHSGEAGTMLYRIDAASGAVGLVRDDGVDEDCGSLINRCMKVTAAIPAPWNPACMILSQRASHMGSTGRITELCGASARQLHSGPCVHSPGGGGCTEEFDHLIARPNAILAAGQNGLIELSAGGPLRRIPAPSMANRGPFHVGFAPDFVAINEDGPPRTNAPLRLILVPRAA